MSKIRHKIQILNASGLHARPAAKIVKVASRFTSHIEISFETKIANAKDMIEIMMLGATQYSWVELLISGNNPLENESALSQLTELISTLSETAA